MTPKTKKRACRGQQQIGCHRMKDHHPNRRDRRSVNLFTSALILWVFFVCTILLILGLRAAIEIFLRF